MGGETTLVMEMERRMNSSKNKVMIVVRERSNVDEGIMRVHQGVRNSKMVQCRFIAKGGKGVLYEGDREIIKEVRDLGET